MAKTILIHENGGPEKMQLADVDVGSPGPGQVKIKHTAVGLNFIDVYTRSGLYPTPLPNAVGREAAGVIAEVGPKVRGFKKGDRVAYCGVLGAYCQERLMGIDQLVPVPKGVSDEQAAAIMLKGMTVEYLVDRCAKPWLKKGDIVLFHAAAGGVGLLFGQWAKARGYKVIGTTSSPEKAALARKNGYKWVIDYAKEDIVARVKEITKGKGVPVVFDGVGKDTWMASLDCLQPRGLMASFGNASGAVAPVSIGILNTKGSLYLTRPSLGSYNLTRKDLEASAKTLFKMVTSGKVKIAIDQRYPLAEAAQAHIDLESRKTTGQTVLMPKPAGPRRVVIVGLTGSIGMGKSTAAGMLRRMGVPVYDADAAVHALQARGGPALPAIEAAFPGVVKDGVLDRQMLAARVFGNRQALRKLESIVHPMVGRRQRAFLKSAALRGEKLVVLDIPLLFEGLGERRVDATLVVSAPGFLQRWRVMARPGMTNERFEGILRQQVADSVKRRKATVVIPTGLGRAPTRAALAKAVAKLKGRPGRSWPPNPWRERFTAELARARRK